MDDDAKEISNCYISSCCPARVTLGVMGFLMFLVTQMVRVNLYIAMVPINEERLPFNVTTFNASEDLLTGIINSTHLPKERTQWDSNASGLLLSAFYWSYWATELPGGLLAQKFGGRNVLGIGVTMSAILNLVLPFCIDTHYLLAAFVRALQGLALGVTWPAMHWLSARWIPQTERSKFMTVYHGAAIGTAITYPLSGIVIEHLGWRWVFYGTGIVALLWSTAWWLYVYDSPSSHPRISKAEKEYLNEKVAHLVTKKGKNSSTPWREILHSRPFWGVLMASQGLMWGTITLSMQTPPYFKSLHHLDIKTIGYFSGIPEVCKFVFSLLFSSFIDHTLKKKWFSLTVARKVAVAVCEYLPAGFLILLAFYGDGGVTTSLILLALTSAVGGASSSGSLANIVDLSPNHAGTVLGLIKTLTIVPGVVSPLVATHLTRPGTSPAESWRSVLLLTAFVYALCSTTFQLCGSGKIQPWNQIKEETNIAEEVEEPLKTNENKSGDC